MEKKSLSGFSLKVIAVILMIIDHAGAFLFPEIKILRIIGRLSFPIFAFMICEGCEHTRDIKKYAERLLIFAILTEPFFDLCKSGVLFSMRGGQNVLFTFFIAVVTIYVCQKQGTWIYSMLGMVAGDLLLADYGAFGVLLVMMLWYNRKEKGEITISLLTFSCGICIMNFIGMIEAGFPFDGEFLYYSTNELFAILASFILFRYNGQKGGNKVNSTISRYIFYAIYPLQFFFFAVFKKLL